MKKRLYNLFITAIIISVAGAMVIFPKQAVSGAEGGIELCINTIIPSLFPFFVISKLIVLSGLAHRTGRVLRPLAKSFFHIPSSCIGAVILGYVGGYPIGASVTAELYERGQCSKSDAEKMLAMCNNSGPAFILGVMGTKIFGSGKVGMAIYVCHILASFIVCLIIRGKKCSEDRAELPPFHPLPFSKALTDSVKQALVSTANICAFIVFFCVIMALMKCTEVFNLFMAVPDAICKLFDLDSGLAAALTVSLFELSTGASMIEPARGFAGSMACAGFMLGWAGLCVHFQTMSLIADTDLSIKKYLILKLLHGIIGGALTGIAGIFLGGSVQAFSQTGYTAVRYISLFYICSAAAAAVLILFILLSLRAFKSSRSS